MEPGETGQEARLARSCPSLTPGANLLGVVTEGALDGEWKRGGNPCFVGHDGKLGHVEDFIIDDEGWSIRYREAGAFR